MSSLLATMAVFSLSMSISPGPVNMVIASSGASHGVRRTLPFVSGATIGFVLLLVMVGLAVRWVALGLDSLMPLLEFFGAAFIAWIGWKIAVSDGDITLQERRAPSFMQGALLQWSNPKAWIACASGAAMFHDPGSPQQFAAFAAIYFAVCYLSLALWALLGRQASLFLTSRRRVRVFNVVMGSLLIGSALQLLLPRLAGLAGT